jgi:hypothetical protein
MENLTPRPQASTLDTASEINETFQDSPTAPEGLGEQTSLPATGLPDLAEAVADDADATQDEATLPHDIVAVDPQDDGSTPSGEAAAASNEPEDITQVPADESLPGSPDPFTQPSAGDAPASRPSAARKAGRPRKQRTLPDVPARQSDPAAIKECIATLRRLDGRDLYTDMERGEALIKLDASCENGKAFKAVLKEHADFGDRHARHLIGVASTFGSEVERWAALGVTATHLRHLVGKPKEYVERCHAEFIRDGVPTTAAFDKKVQADFAIEAEETKSDAGEERRAFFKAVARRTADQNVDAFLAPLKQLADILQSGLKVGATGEPQVKKPLLAKQAALPARTACRVLESLFTTMNFLPSYNGLQYFSRVTVEVPELQALRVVLMQLQRADDWPKADPGLWIAKTVLPLIQWSAGLAHERPDTIEAIIAYGSSQPPLCFTFRDKPEGSRKGMSPS